MIDGSTASGSGRGRYDRGCVITRRGVLLGGLALAGGAVCIAACSAPDRPGRSTARRSSAATAGAPRPTALSLPVYDRRPVKILVHHTATPNSTDLSQDAASGSPGRSRTSTWTAAAGPTPASTSRSAAAASCSRAATAAWSSCAAGGRRSRARTAPGQNVVAVGIENEGTYTAVDPPPALWNRLRPAVRLHLRAVRHRGPPRSSGTATSRTPPAPATCSTPTAPAAHRGRGRCSGRARDGDGRAQRVAAAAHRRPRPARARRPAPAARGGRSGVVPDGRFTRELADAVRAFQAERGFGRDDPAWTAGTARTG